MGMVKKKRTEIRFFSQPSTLLILAAYFASVALMYDGNVRSQDAWLTEIIVILPPVTTVWQSNITIHFLKCFITCLLDLY